MARRSVLLSGAFASSRYARHTSGRQVSGPVANGIVPRLAALAFEPGEHTINGVRLLIPSGAGVGAGGEFHMALGTYEMGEVAYVLSHLNRGGGMIDVGAHIGNFGIPAAAKVGPEGRTIAVEPTASSATTLRHNVALNGFHDRVTVIEAAASDRTGVGAVHVSGTSQMFNTLEADTLVGDVQLRDVFITTVDDVLERAAWPPIDILKMDVEGHECSVLRGAAQTLARYPLLDVLFEASGTSDERFRVSLDTINLLAAQGFGFVDGAGRASDADVEALKARMRMPRWQDTLFNVVAPRS